MRFCLNLFLVLPLAFFVGLTGCGAPEAKRIKVSGSITMGGKPMTGLPPGVRPMVRFEPEGKNDPVFAKVEDGGAFSVEVIPGKYKITGSSGMFPLGPPKGSKDKDFVISMDIQSDMSDLTMDLQK